MLAASSLALWRWLDYRPQQVLAERVYRSRQPDARELRRAAVELGLRSVVNLRGAQPGQDWYDDELATTTELSLDRLDLRFRSFDWPPRAEVRRLVRYLEVATPPTLLHCQAGVHRAGWASAVVLALAGRPLSEVREQLATVRRSLTDARPDFSGRFFDLYESWLALGAHEHSAKVFRHWVLDVYCPPPYNAEIIIREAPALDAVPGGTALTFVVGVTNRSDETWQLSAIPQHGIRLGASVLGPYTTAPKDPLELFRRPGRPGRDLARAGLENATVAPDETRNFDLKLLAPSEPGRYLLHFDMVDEGVHWFSDLGTPGVVVELEVVAAAR